MEAQRFRNPQDPVRLRVRAPSMDPWCERLATLLTSGMMQVRVLPGPPPKRTRSEGVGARPPKLGEGGSTPLLGSMS